VLAAIFFDYRLANIIPSAELSKYFYRIMYNSVMYIKVKVMAGAKKEKVIKKSEDNFVISVKEKAKANIANKRILEIVSDIYKTKKIRIISGHQSPSKILSVGD